MKFLVRKFIPPFLLWPYRHLRRVINQRQNSRKTTEEVFTDIYERSKWGGTQGQFCSGDGTTKEKVVSPYLSMITQKAEEEGFLGSTFVDLGCGDFRIGRKLLPLCSEYIGVDIVKPLIDKNREMYGDTTTHFMHQNIVEDDLPKGGVCFIRQVLQHLSNKQILAILPKLKQYRWVFITEHYPADDELVAPNMDKPHGPDIRAYDRSGVYLTEPPFSLPKQSVEEVLAVPGAGLQKGMAQGVIRTFLYKWNN